jgi:hypothetical protein
MEIKRTITSIFIVPTLSIGKEKLVDNGYINGYIKDGKRDVQYENAVYLLFKPKSLDKFKEFLDEEYERTKQIIDDYDYEDGYVVIVYQLDKKFKKDFDLIKQGKYSKTSKEFQNTFPKVIKIQKGNRIYDQISTQYRIFNKTQDLKEYWEEKLDIEFDDSMEFWQGFVEENEILNLDKLKENV